ncbi:hypothetical protein LZD49_12365 [Dyadobacter sp. CY261]|uniref:hypothetical protein n=1 Tax=Dyadobacter sp. CY261 TaxID=2907203 RepID=UPI001F451493|nr:hypothetical protein [Dyadobacter sp. CY261]MCF0071266.1 hypothetical protein [Dyadobacter sp. CY261]
MKILFWFRKSESKDLGKSVDPTGNIQCRITIQNATVEIGSTSITCLKSRWNPAEQRVRGDSSRAERGNRRLREITSALEKLYDILSAKYPYVSPSTVKDYYLTKRKFIYSLGEIIGAFMLHREALVKRKAITKSTLETNENYARHITAFCKARKINGAIEIQDTFFHDLFDWMIVSDRAGERFSRKVCEFAKQILTWGYKKKMCPPLAAFAESMPGHPDSDEDMDTTHLSIIELTRLIDFDFNKLVSQKKIVQQTADTLSAERDAFVFNCFTGMHHCDYTNKDFQIEVYKETYFLTGQRQKTKKRFSIKLLNPAVRILERYGSNLQNLPAKSNQKRNATLKQIAVFVELPVVLSTKIARKTFSDMAINEMMMSLDDVAQCIGLTSTKYLKHYARIRQQRLLKIMPNWDELKEAS